MITIVILNFLEEWIHNLKLNALSINDTNENLERVNKLYNQKLKRVNASIRIIIKTS